MRIVCEWYKDCPLLYPLIQVSWGKQYLYVKQIPCGPMPMVKPLGHGPAQQHGVLLYMVYSAKSMQWFD